MTKLPKYIGLIGAAGAGKDEVYKALRRTGYRKLAFGDGVRYEVESLVTADDDTEFVEVIRTAPDEIRAAYIDVAMRPAMLWQKPTSRSARLVLQWHGTEFRRSQNPDYWVDIAASRISEPGFVFTDVRFENECEFVLRLDGELWLVERPGLTQMEHRSELLAATYPREQFSQIIINDSDIAALHKKVIDALYKPESALLAAA